MHATTSKDSVYFFGYGSLIWNPGFAYTNKEKKLMHMDLPMPSNVPGQNTISYEAIVLTSEKFQPGRVATLVRDEDSFATGVVFEVVGEDNIREAFVHLWEREINNGYDFVEIAVEIAGTGDVINAWTCIARLDNEFYLGDADIEQMAVEIRRARGCAGPNFEYVLKLAEHVRLLFPDDEDEHLFELESRIRLQGVAYV
ncbi:ChaC-like protein [Cooperia oncophora]